MRKRHVRPRKATENSPSGKPNEPEGTTGARDRYPWETANEYQKFLYYLFQGPGRSVRKAYRNYCIDSGIEPKKDPPSSWYQLYRGEYLAFRKAEQQSKAIQHAGEVHGRFPDWERLEDTIQHQGELEKYKDNPEIYEVMHDLTIVEYAFWSLATDKNGDPTGDPTWDERVAAWEAAGRPQSDATDQSHIE